MTSVVKEDQLGKPEERLREKIERMWPLTPTRATEEIVGQDGRRESEKSLRKEEEAKEAKTAKEREERLRREEEQSKEVRDLKEQLRRAEQQAKEAKEREERLRREEEQAKEVRELKEQLRRAEQQAKEAKEREENMRRVEALAFDLLKKTNASSQSVTPDSTVPQKGKKYQRLEIDDGLFYSIRLCTTFSF